MFFKPAFVISALAILTAANPIVARTGGGAPPPPPPVDQCNTGSLECCNSVTKASDANATKILGLLNVVLEDLNVDVGLTCVPISIIGGVTGSCSASPVCCTGNNYHGLIVIGCSPIIL